MKSSPAPRKAAARTRALALLVLLAVVATMGFSTKPGAAAAQDAAAEQPAAMVWSDSMDYEPGSVVTLTGSGWTPGEIVRLGITKERGEEVFEPVALAPSVADADGNFVNNSFSTGADDRGVRYTLTATGETSGRTWVTNFNDQLAPCASVTIGSATTTPTAGSNVTLTSNFTPNNANTTGLTYQWQRLVGGVYQDIHGATQSTYSFVIHPADSGASFKVRVNYATVKCGNNTFVNGSVTSASPFTFGTINKTTPTINWSPANVKFYGNDMSGTLAGATVSPNTPGTFAYSAKAPGAAAFSPVTPSSLFTESGNWEFSVTFTPTNTTDYNPATKSGVKVNAIKAPLTVTADNAARPYGEPNPTFTGTIQGVVLGDNITATYGTAATQASPVGHYPIVPSVSDNGTGTLSNYAVQIVNGDLEITARAVEVTADPQSKTYGQPDPALTYQITSGSLANGDVFSGTLSRAPGETVAGGPYAINQGTLSLGNNYALTFVGADLTINPKVVTASVTVEDKVYDGNNVATIATRTANGVINGDDVSVTGGSATFDDKNVGTDKPVSVAGLSLAGADAGNYNLSPDTAETAADITPRPVSVKADHKTKTYGDADPALTYTITSGNLVGNDTFSGSLTRAAGETVAGSPYAIGQGTLALSSNYALTFTGDTLEITPRPVTVTADPKSKTYGDADPALTYQITSGNLVNGDTFTGALTRVAGENVVGSPYTINQGTLSLSSNYALTYVGSALTINPRPLSIKANDASKFFGDADPALSYTITSGNLVNGDALTGAISRTAGESVGTYSINQGTLTAGPNYAISFTNGTFTIKAWTLTGFYQPVDMTPAGATALVLNSIRGGSTVPLKFEVFAGAAEKTSVADIQGFQVAEFACTATPATLSEVEFTTTGGTSLRYDPTAGQFVQNWQTPKTTGKCYQVRMTAKDGSKIDAFFKTK